MASAPAGPTAPHPGAPRPLDPGLVRLAVTVMHITVFFSLLGLGYPPEQALPMTAAVGIGSLTVADWFLGHRRDGKDDPRDRNGGR